MSVSAQFTTDPNYSLIFRGPTPGSLTGKRFSTSLLAANRIFQISNITIDQCAAACDIDQECIGFYFRIDAGGLSTACLALNNLGTTNGIATTTNSFSYAKQVRYCLIQGFHLF